MTPETRAYLIELIQDQMTMQRSMMAGVDDIALAPANAVFGGPAVASGVVKMARKHLPALARALKELQAEDAAESTWFYRGPAGNIVWHIQAGTAEECRQEALANSFSRRGKVVCFVERESEPIEDGGKA